VLGNVKNSGRYIPEVREIKKFREGEEMESRNAATGGRHQGKGVSPNSSYDVSKNKGT